MTTLSPDHRAAIRWRGHWVAPEPRAMETTPEAFLTGTAQRHTFSRSIFRTTFEVTETPAGAPARLTADSRYVLWINGHEIGRGPARSQPYRQRYDSYDIASHLVAGRNVITVLVTYYGAATSFWQPAAAGARPDAALRASRPRSATVWSSPTTVAACTARRRGPSCGGPTAARACRWRSSTPDSSREAGRLRRSTTRAGIGQPSSGHTHPASLGRTRRRPTRSDAVPRDISPLHEERIALEACWSSSLRPAPAWLEDHPVTRALQSLDHGAVPDAGSAVRGPVEIRAHQICRWGSTSAVWWPASSRSRCRRQRALWSSCTTARSRSAPNAHGRARTPTPGPVTSRRVRTTPLPLWS